MKVSSEQLAQALFESVSGKDKKEAEKMVSGLVKLMAEGNILNKEDEVIAAFSRIWDANNGIVEAKATVAHPLSAKNKDILINYITGKTGAKQVNISEEIDESQLGGVVVNYQDKVARASLMGWIGELKAQLSN